MVRAFLQISWSRPGGTSTRSSGRPRRAAVILRSDKTERRIELITGGVIEFWSLVDPDAGRSRKYKRVVIDEAAKVREPRRSPGTRRSGRRSSDFRGDADFLLDPQGPELLLRAGCTGARPLRPRLVVLGRCPPRPTPGFTQAEIAGLKQGVARAGVRPGDRGQLPRRRRGRLPARRRGGGQGPHRRREAEAGPVLFAGFGHRPDRGLLGERRPRPLGPAGLLRPLPGDELDASRCRRSRRRAGSTTGPRSPSTRPRWAATCSTSCSARRSRSAGSTRSCSPTPRRKS